MIDITLLGTSALLPLPERAETAAVLSCGGHSILFDCGEGTQTAARKAGVSLVKVDIIALTHYHGDHIFGLPGLLQTIQIMGREKKLTIVGPEAPEIALAPILALVGTLAFPLELRTVPKQGLALEEFGFPDGAVLTAFPTEHRVVSQGYAFTLPRAGKFQPENARALGVPQSQWGLLQRGQSVTVSGREILPAEVLGPARRGLKVAFSGDTTRCTSLVEGARDADLFLCEATYGGNDQRDMAYQYGHMNFAQAGAAAAAAGVQELWLMHYSQMIEDPKEFLPNAQAFFENTVCGQDGMRKKLTF